MPLTLRLAAPLLLLGLLATNAYGQDSDQYKVKDSATPCLKIRPQPTTDSNPTDCLAPGTQVTVVGVDSLLEEGPPSERERGMGLQTILGAGNRPFSSLSTLHDPAGRLD
jgi:hypothetical protein